MELNNEEKAKVGGLYIGSECRLLAFGKEYDGILTGIKQGFNNRYIEYWVKTSGNYASTAHKSYDCNLLLTPLSGITDEHAIEVAKMLMPGYLHRQYSVVKENNRTDVWFGRYCVHIYFDGAIQAAEMTNWVDNTIYQYLISKGYDVPQWFGIGHPCNGLTPIQLGIAINKNSTL